MGNGGGERKMSCLSRITKWNEDLFLVRMKLENDYELLFRKNFEEFLEHSGGNLHHESMSISKCNANTIIYHLVSRILLANNLLKILIN